MTNISKLLTAIHKSEHYRLCKISPANRESDRATIVKLTKAFLEAGNKINEIPNNFSTENKKAA